MKQPQFFERFTPYLDKLKVLLFGVDNIRIERLLDAFFNLKPAVRNKIMVYSIMLAVFLCLVVFFSYLYAMGSLQDRLEASLELERQVLVLQPRHGAVQQQFDQLSTSLFTANQNAVDLPTVLQSLATDAGVQLTIVSATPQITVLPSNHPLASRFKLGRIDCILKNASLKKIMDYIGNIQASPNRFIVSSLDIEQIFGTKLYFDVHFSVEVYIPS